MARTAEVSTEALPLDCNICTLATVPFRRMSNVTTARGAKRTDGSTVLCSQLLLTRLRHGVDIPGVATAKITTPLARKAHAGIRPTAAAQRELRVGNCRGSALSVRHRVLRWRWRLILQGLRRARDVVRLLLLGELRNLFGLGGWLLWLWVRLGLVEAFGFVHDAILGDDVRGGERHALHAAYKFDGNGAPAARAAPQIAVMRKMVDTASEPNSTECNMMDHTSGAFRLWSCV